ncbi:hypothetical protein AVEN_109315-1 [Araneus ventricosus]|uniref:Uncharacterized protein n=1 Tax=Araneus ventricosus TaxID=182803 RepID=A0A4Y2D337_ARAVE|nr:hypothetical protein AVEN_109315-1 [Araneus ventricosus]
MDHAKCGHPVFSALNNCDPLFDMHLKFCCQVRIPNFTYLVRSVFELSRSNTQEWNINYSVRHGFSRTAEVLSNILLIGEMLVTRGEWISLTNSGPFAILVFFIYNGYHHM